MCSLTDCRSAYALALLAALMLTVIVGVAPACAQVADSEAENEEAVEHEDDAAEHDEAAEHGDDAHAGDPNPLAVDLDLAIWTGVIFVVLFLVLSRFAWPQIVVALEARERGIADNIAAAQKQLADASDVLKQHEAKLAGAADEVRALLEEARRDAEHTKTEIIAEAKKAAQEESQRAVREVEQAKDAALHELANRSANAAIELAGNVVRQQIDPNRQAEIIREALAKLSTGPSNN